MSKRKTPGEKHDIFVFDTETSGLGQRAEILQFAGVLLDGESLEEKHVFESLIRPSSIDVLRTEEAKKALSMNHLDKRVDELMAAPTKLEFVQQWWEIRRQYRKPWVPAGYNIGNFDLPKLRYLFWQIRKEKPTFTIDDFFHYHIIDAMCLYIARNWYRNDSAYVRLKDACATLGIENVKAHDAMSDVRATADVLRSIFKEMGKI
jgi:DNA polymerase III epsilon subunit-like protein